MQPNRFNEAPARMRGKTSDVAAHGYAVRKLQ